ncbi:hypothetical protein FLAG1_00387 [Fusarium langsethiae]|uniref:Uncharacterized protein n=1 Tax=Fusarium langsethiae TaxID=179993 RepID=A0A0N0V8W4_FUSLA|nr:hypothetical protein FLAG1_00387 [Fusarium langsethiae]GKT98720.1 unnamed protein product [Fusarium langsethiae]GKU18033.1 unnamed protein product [Fusarium langsethiae]
MSRFGHDVLSVFDVVSSDQDFLADVIESSRGQATRAEFERLLQESLLAGAQDWHYLVESAILMRQTCRYDIYSIEAQDVLAYVRCILDGRIPPSDSGSDSEPWNMTDRLIARAKELEGNPEIRPPQIPGNIDKQRLLQRPGPEAFSNTRNHFKTSPYWSDQPQKKVPNVSRKWSAPSYSTFGLSQIHISLEAQDDTLQDSSLGGLAVEQGSPQEVTMSDKDNTPSVKPNSVISPYFTGASASTLTTLVVQKRPPRGTVPSVPFAPLTSPDFGLIQEKVAHEPFWLLIAVSFLIKTKGIHAVPLFYKFKERFPTPADIACESNAKPIIEMIRHLGLANHRVALIQKYARGFLDDPPAAGKLCRVKKYDCRDVVFPSVSGDYALSQDNGGNQDLEAWEIGHLTQGKYAIDSWRIFCRDELLGRAEDWMGKGREPEFQPEWMRVRPDDKELRAYLRWMWMKEGWEWDPITGDRTVLREEMRNAVNEGRVEYDDRGGLKLKDGLIDPSL